VLRNTFGPKRGEVTGECGRLHNEELYDLYRQPNSIYVNKINETRWAEHVARMGEKRRPETALVGESEQ